MASFWKTKPGTGRNESPHIHDGEEGEITHQNVEPDEHTRLLPQPSTRDGYLSPDDPAVSSDMTTAFEYE